MVLRVAGLQESVTAEVAQHPTFHRVLEVLREPVGKGGAFLEAEAGMQELTAAKEAEKDNG